MAGSQAGDNRPRSLSPEGAHPDAPSHRGVRPGNRRLALEIPGLHPVDPQGGFYLYARYDHALSAREVRARVWDEGVAVRSGTEFGAAGERHLRLSYSVDEATIEQGMAVVADVFRKLG